MYIINNCITLCKYFINKMVGFTDVNCVEFECKNCDDDEIDCNCNLCYTFRNIIFFATRYLRIKKDL